VSYEEPPSLGELAESRADRRLEERGREMLAEMGITAADFGAYDNEEEVF